MKFISADELKKQWGILDFELLNFIRDGLSAYDLIGRRTITDSEVSYEKEETIDEFRQRLFIRERKHEIERIEKNNSAEYAINAHRLINKGLLDSKLPPPEMYDEEKVRKRVEIRIAEEYNQLPSFPVVPRNRRLIPSELNDSDLHKVLDEIKTFQFKTQEINRFAQLHGLKQINYAEIPQDNKTTTQPTLSGESYVSGNKDSESFIRSLQVSYVSDTEIRIKGGGKNAKTYSQKELGFIYNGTKTWKAFKQILNSPDHFYNAAIIRGTKGEKNKSYAAELKVVPEISKKLVTFLNEKYQAQLPKGFKVYEKEKDEEFGTDRFKFKFKIIDNKESDREYFNALPEAQLLMEIENLSKQIETLEYNDVQEAEGQIEEIKKPLKTAVLIAHKKNWLTPNRAKHYFQIVK